MAFDASSSSAGLWVIPGYEAPWGSCVPGSLVLDPITSYTWNFGDNSVIETWPASTVSHVFARDGLYSVMLTVRTQNGQSNSTSKSVSVVATSPPPPPLPPPPPPPAPRALLLKIANGGQLLGTTAAIPLTCALTTSCDGVLRLIDQAPRLRSAKIKRPTVYGSARFSIKPGRTKTTRITLNAAGRKKLGKRKRLTLVAMAVVGSKVFSSRVTLNVKRKRN